MGRRKKKEKIYQEEIQTVAKEPYTFLDEPNINVKPKYQKPPNPYKS